MPTTYQARNSLVDHVVQEIREMILTRQLGPGAFLPPHKTLAAQFGVGVSTIHEAIQVLTVLGLVEAHPGKGTWVRPDATAALLHPTAVRSRLAALNARQLYEARLVIEVGLTKFAAQKATPQDLRRIQAAVQAVETAPDNKTFVEADLEFHLAVAQAGHNELLEQFYHVARQLLADLATELIALPTVKKDSLPLQAAVARAIAQHDVAQAEKAALAHMAYIESLLDRYA